MKEQEVKVKYRSGLHQKGDINGKAYMEYDHDYVSVATKHTKRFSSAVMLLMGISGCELHLIDWLTDNMTVKNYVNNNGITRRNFISFYDRYKKKGAKSYTEETVRKAFQALTAAGLLIPVERGLFQVNPEFFFSGEEAERIKSIKLLMEFKAGIETRITVEVKK